MLKSFFITFLFFIALIGCGSKDTTRITINTMFPVKSPASADLSKTMFTMMVPNIGSDCYQEQIYLVTHNPETNQFMDRRRIQLITNYSGGGALPAYANTHADLDIAIQLMRNYSYLDAPLTLDVPRGTPVEVGIMGNFFEPKDAANNITYATGSPDGKCDQLFNYATPSIGAVHSSSLIGHTLIDPNTITDVVSLNVDVLHANPLTSGYDLTLPANRYRDWIELSPHGTITPTNNGVLNLISVHYLDNLINVPVYTSDTVEFKKYIPHIFPMRLIFGYVGLSVNCSGGSSCSGYYYADVFNDSNLSSLSLTLNLITMDALRFPSSFARDTLNINYSITNH